MGLRDLAEGMKEQGYDKEEEYFKRKERDLIEKMRRDKQQKDEKN